MTDASEPMGPESLLAQADWLRKLARKLVRDADVAEDVVQDTLVAALEHGESFRARTEDTPEAGLRAWLATVARNFARRRYRAGSIRRYHEALAARSRGEAEEAAEELELLRTQKALTEAILALREPYRSAVVLRYQKGLSHGALAKRLGITPAAARKRVSRGVALLRERLDEAHGGQRVKWCSALVVFARRPVGAAASTLTIGGITVGTKTAGVAAAAAVTLIAGWAVTSDSSTPAAPVARANAARPQVELAPLTEELGLVDASARSSLGVAGPEIRAVEAPAATVDAERLLRGRVTDGAGSPLENARVEVRRDELRGYSSLDLDHDKRGRLFATLSTDAEGLFSVEVPRGLPFDLEAAHPGWASGLVPGAYAGEFCEIELALAARMTGRVVRADGSGVAGAEIVGRLAGGARLRIFAGETDERGRFEFADLGAGPVRVQVLPREEASLFWVSVTLVAGETLERDFLVEPGYRVTGRVVDERTGRPIEGAEVGQGWTFDKSVLTDAAGRYTLAGFVTQGVYEVNARAPGYGRVDLDLPTARENEIVADFALPPSVSARGRLVAESGEPIAGAYLACLSSFTDWRPGRSGEDGRFEVVDMQPGAAQVLFVVAESFGTCAFEFPRPVLSAGRYELGDVVLRPGGLLRGRVIDPAGNPLPDLTVTLVADYHDRFALSGPLDDTVGDHYVAAREGRTDHLGRFSFGDLSRGSYSLSAGDQGQNETRSAPVFVGAGQEVVGVEIVLDAGLEIHGTVVDELGEPVPWVAVTIHPELPTEGRMAQVITDGEGRFHSKGFAAGTYRVEAFPVDMGDGKEPRDLLSVDLEGVSPDGQALRIVLPSSSATSGVVVDSAGRNVQHAMVLARDGEGRRVAADFTDSAGAFRLELEPGSTVDLSAKAPPDEGAFYFNDGKIDATSAQLPGVRAGSTDLRLALPPLAGG